MKNTQLQAIKTSWDFLSKKHKYAIISLFAFQSLAGILEMAALNASAIFIATVIDPEFTNRNEAISFVFSYFGGVDDRDSLIIVGVITAILLASGFLLNFLVQFLSEYMGYRISRYLTSNALAKMIRTPYQWFHKQNAAETAQRLFSDGSAFGAAVFPSLLELAYSGLLLVIASAVIVWTLSTETIFVAFAMAGVSVLTITIVRPLIARRAQVQRDSALKCNRNGIEIIRGAKEIQLKGRERFYVSGFMVPFEAWCLNRVALNILQRATPLVLLLVGQIGLISIVLLMLKLEVPKGELTVQVALLGVIVSRLVPAISRAAGNVTKLTATIPYISSYSSFIRELDQAHPTDASGCNKKIPDNWQSIELKDVSFGYSLDQPAVRGLNIKIDNKRIHGFLGRSGSGKTTTIDLIARLYGGYTGKILIDHEDFTQFSRKDWYHRIGYVVQTPFLSDDSLRRNIAIGMEQADIDEAHLAWCVAAAGLEETIQALPRGLETPVGDAGMQLSGGQKQRIAIARALYDRPDVLILDEATSALDSLTEKAIQETVRSLKGSITIIIIAHRLSTLRDCDRLFLLDNGKVVGQGSWDELTEASDLFRQMQQGQLP